VSVAGAPALAVLLQVRDSDSYNPSNSGVFDEIDFEFLNGNPTPPNSVWLNTFKR
jgi:hypothetical protein